MPKLTKACVCSLTEFEFGLGDQLDGGDAAHLINAHLNSGLCFEGLPILIELENNGTTYNLFEGYLDTSKALYDCDRIIIQSVEKKGVDYINEVFDSKSFAYIYEVEGLITDSDFVNIPYVLSELPEGKEAFIASISGWAMFLLFLNSLTRPNTKYFCPGLIVFSMY